ncbi:elongation factor 4 [Candidatus Levyibacteriota bacterium]|nr:elongation factor 4 [Candidatus Levybacteria bacterium]GDX62307.1 elongation factor 4 [Candidatus Levybacteria bacterium]
MSQKNIRNFAIIAHVDHGKSTLADRFLEMTGVIGKDKQEQFLDQNPISRERGITIKLAPVRMEYNLNSSNYILNLIDTPGHVDFSYEVSRTLAACEGAILLVDATQSIQAQTVAHFNAARREKLTIIPVINKIDLQNADIEGVTQAIHDTFGFAREDILHISAKTGIGVDELLAAIIDRIPPPTSDSVNLRALIFDAVYDEHRGVIAYIRVKDGVVEKGDKVQFIQSQAIVDANDVGYFTPFLEAQSRISAGEIGYLVAGIKDIQKSRVGDTIVHPDSVATALPGYKMPKPMVFFGVFPKQANELVHLRQSLDKLRLNDTALSFADEYSAFLGSGFRIGFLGLLHAEIVKERLRDEFDLELLFTMPRVLYKKEDEVWLEPYMQLSVFVSRSYVGGVISVCQKRKGELIDIAYQGDQAILYYKMPYVMLIRGLVSELKTISSGFASVDYELGDYIPASLAMLDILVNNTAIDVLSELVYKDEAQYIARIKVEKLKESLNKQQYRQVIQGTIDGHIIAREEISPFRKDVLAKMSGGDRTRKDKLLDKQKKGKSKLYTTSKVDISQEALLSMIEGFDSRS